MITEARYTSKDFSAARDALMDWVATTFAGTIIIGNGRSVLGQGAGPLVDRFGVVVRFNDYQISGYEEDIGSKTDIWCVSDWTCVKLLNLYPDRKLPVLIAIPYKFMGKPYYSSRRAELEAELTADQLARATFVPAETVKQMIEPPNHFGAKHGAHRDTDSSAHQSCLR